MNRFGVLGTTLTAVLMLASCTSAQTGSASLDATRTGTGSADGQVGHLRLLRVSVAAPGTRGSFHVSADSAALFLTIANDGTADDVLTGVRADAAHQVVVRIGDAPPAPQLQVTVPAAGIAALPDVAGEHLELSGLRQILRTGSSVPVTFQFRDAGTLTLDAPITTYSDVRPDRESVAAP